MSQYSFAGLFSGIGGFDLGLQRAGFQCRAAVDNDPVALAVHERNLRAPVYECDLSSHFPLETELSGLDLLVAGPPCQGFSTVGKRQLDDPRNRLLIAAGSIAIRLAPKVFVVENVPGVVSGGHREYWAALHDMLRVAGYATADTMLDASHFGLAQRRRRQFLIAWRTGKEVRALVPESGKSESSLSDALVGVADCSEHDPLTLEAGSPEHYIALRIAQGQKLCDVRDGPSAVHSWDIPEVFGSTTPKQRKILSELLRMRRRLRLRNTGDADPVRAADLARKLGFPVAKHLRSLEDAGFVRSTNGRFDLRHGFNGKYRRLRWDAPAHTVDSHFGSPRYVLHPNEHRGMSVRETARIQGFPDDFAFIGSRDAKHRMLGNAVAPPVAHALGCFVRDHLLPDH